MSNLDILEVALNNIRNKLTSFYSLVADIDNRLVNAENYLLDNGDTLNPILSNIDEGSIFTIYSEATRDTRTEPIRLEDIHLRATKPFLNNPATPLNTCNVLMTPITFSNFNRYFTSRLSDTLEFYITDLRKDIRLSLESNEPFLVGPTLLNNSNFKIINNSFTIQPDFRDMTIDINIRALDSSNVLKYEQYNSFNYLSDPYTIRIIEQFVSPIIQHFPTSNTIIFPHTAYYINNHIKQNVLFLKTNIASVDNSVITNVDNILSLYYEYELPIENVVFTTVPNNNYCNINTDYYYNFDYRGSNNETKDTILQVKVYDPLYYTYYENSKTITNIIIKEPSPINLISESYCNLIETAYNSFEIDFDKLFINNVNNPIIYSLSSNIIEPLNNRYNNKELITYNTDTTIQINTDYRGINYDIIIKAIDPTYPTLPTYYNVNVTEKEAPIPTITTSILEYSNAVTLSSSINLNNYFTSGTSNINLQYSLTSNNYPTDYYADIFSITDNILKVTLDRYYNDFRTLQKTIVATDVIYNVSNMIDVIFYQKPIINVIKETDTLNDIYTSTHIIISNYLTLNKHNDMLMYDITSNNVPKSRLNPDNPLVTKNHSDFIINPDYRNDPYNLTISSYINTPLYSNFKFNFSINVNERKLTLPYVINETDKFVGKAYTLSNNEITLNLESIFFNTIIGTDLKYIVNPIDTTRYSITADSITFKPAYRSTTYNLVVKASNLEYNIISTDSFKINITEENPIVSIKDFEIINTNDIKNYNLTEYFNNKAGDFQDINFSIRYLDYINIKNEINVRSNIDNTKSAVNIIDNSLETRSVEVLCVLCQSV